MKEFLHDLQSGKVRVAYQKNGEWIVDKSVKKQILQCFKSPLVSFDSYYQEKESLSVQKLDIRKNIRMLPFGSTVRSGAFIGADVVIMPPSYINIGAYVDQGTMIDSHVLVGSCAQIGKYVHLSAGVSIGGVLEPIGDRPVIIEDRAFIGAGSIIVEGVMVREGAIVAPNVTLTKSIPIYDLVHERMIEDATIPANAIVVNGSRQLKSDWARAQGLSSNIALIIKYRDKKSDQSIKLEDLLR